MRFGHFGALRNIAISIKCAGVASLAFLASLALSVATPAASEWRFAPEIRLSGGNESDLVIDPGLTRTVVPGGSFFELAPTIAARRWVGRGAMLDLGTFATVQRFFNDESRLLYAQTVWGDLYQSFHNGLRLRLSTGFDYFDDSERETVRRLGLGGEIGIGYVNRNWSVELWGGGRGRRYPNLPVQDGRNQSSTYTETSWSGATTLRVTPVERVSLRGDGILQTTVAADPFYDSQSWTVFTSVDARLVSRVFLTISGTYQERDFTERTSGEDRDSYWQIGAGLRYVVVPGWTATARWGQSNYTWTDGEAEDSYRFSAAIQYSWGPRDAPPPSRVDVGVLTRSSGGSIQQPGPAGNVRFRIRAAAAENVFVAGDFNGWSPEAEPLRPTGDGWWETRVELDPGSYEYAYVIDGEWTTPPEAKLIVEDGFGGRNGILEVLPPGL
jgi:hypothetical protein